MKTNDNYLYNQYIEILRKLLNDYDVNTNKIKQGNIPVFYNEYKLRTFENIKHEVFVSQELLKNKEYQKFKNVINQIIEKAKTGNNLNVYLSKSIKNNITKPDKMLNDWGIIHLHLGDKQKNGYVNRTNELLFIYRDNQDKTKLYILDIFSHGDWSMKKTIEILRNNWKNVIEKYRIKETTDVHPKLDDDGHKQIRDFNANAPIVIENDSYLTIGGGFNLIGTNMLSTFFMIRKMKELNNIENQLINVYNIKKEQIKLLFCEGNFFVEIKNGQKNIYKHLFKLS